MVNVQAALTVQAGMNTEYLAWMRWEVVFAWPVEPDCWTWQAGGSLWEGKAEGGRRLILLLSW